MREETPWEHMQGAGPKGTHEAPRVRRHRGRGQGDSHLADVASHVRRTRRFGCGGFTLLEIMLALVLLSTGTVAIMSLMQRAHAGMAGGENVLIATHLADWKIEELRNTAYASVASESKASITSPSGFTRFNRAVTVTTPYTSLKKIVVTVSWDTQGGEADVSLQTHRYND